MDVSNLVSSSSPGSRSDGFRPEVDDLGSRVTRVALDVISSIRSSDTISALPGPQVNAEFPSLEFFSMLATGVAAFLEERAKEVDFFNEMIEKKNPQLLRSLLKEKKDWFVYGWKCGTFYNEAKARGATWAQEILMEQFLASKGYSGEKFQNFDDRILFEAIEKFDLELIRLLLEFGVDLYQRNERGLTPYQYAKSKVFFAIQYFFVERVFSEFCFTDCVLGSEECAISVVIHQNRTDLVKALLLLGLDPNTVYSKFTCQKYDELISYHDIRPIHHAVITKQPEMLAALIEGGAALFTRCKILNGEKNLFFELLSLEDREIFLDMLVELPEKHLKRFITEFKEEYNFSAVDSLELQLEHNGTRYCPFFLAIIASLPEYRETFASYFSCLRPDQCLWILGVWQRQCSKGQFVEIMSKIDLSTHLLTISSCFSEKETFLFYKYVPLSIRVRLMTEKTREIFSSLRSSDSLNVQTISQFKSYLLSLSPLFRLARDLRGVMQQNKRTERLVFISKKFMNKEKERIVETHSRLNALQNELIKQKRCKDQPTIKKDEKEDLFVYLSSLGLNYPKEYLEILGVRCEELSSFGIAEVPDLHALELKNDLIYILDYEKDEKISPWWEENKKQIETLYDSTQNADIKKFIEYIEGVLKSEESLREEEKNNLKALDRRRRVACLRAYLGQTGIKAFFTDGKTVTDLKRSPLKLYQLKD